MTKRVDDAAPDPNDGSRVRALLHSVTIVVVTLIVTAMGLSVAKSRCSHQAAWAALTEAPQDLPHDSSAETSENPAERPSSEIGDGELDDAIHSHYTAFMMPKQSHVRVCGFAWGFEPHAEDRRLFRPPAC